MISHNLGLECPETLNPYILRIDDISVYDSLLDVSCPRLYIKMPGFSRSAEIIPTIDRDSSGSWIPFRGIYTSKQLNVANKSFCKLPDGIYTIRYSVAPNNLVYKEYTHLRTTELKNRIYQIYCDMNLSSCEPNKDTEKKLELLDKIEQYIKAAVSKVEVCGDYDGGMELYNYAKKLLGKFDCKCC